MFNYRSVTKWAIILTAVAMSNVATGQTYYQFSLDSGAYNDLTGATSFNTTPPLWDDEEVHIPIGFDFTFYDLTFDSLYVSDYVWFNDLTGDYWIDVFSADLIDRGPVSPSSPRSYKTEGAVGSRIMKIEWNNAGFYYENSSNGTTDDFVNFQLWLYEDSSKVEIRYGASSILNPDASFNGDEGAPVGLNTNANQSYLIGTADNPSVVNNYASLVGTPETGTIYIFEHCPVPVADFTWIQDSTGLYQFQNSSLNGVSYVWGFSDGTSSTDTNVIFTPGPQTGAEFQVTLTVTGHCGLISFSTSTVVTGVESFISDDTYIEIAPNPAQQNFVILTVSNLGFEKMEYAVYDMFGRKITIGMINSINTEIDLSGISDGTYMVFVSGKNGKLACKKIIKN